MSGGGGFLPTSTYDPPAHGTPRTIDTADRKPAVGPEPLLKLTARQEGRLRQHVDTRLADLERDSKTQYDRYLLIPLLFAYFLLMGYRSVDSRVYLPC